MAVTTLTSANRMASGFVFPECPRWHEDKLWFSDINDDKLFTLEKHGSLKLLIDAPGPRGIDFLPDGRLILATKKDGIVWILEKGKLRPYADLNAFCTRGLNDMVVDGRGNAYVDAYLLTPGMPHGSIVLVRPGGSVREVAGDLITPNGLVITPDGKRLIAAQTGRNELTEFSIQPDGTLSNRRTFAKVEGQPDGICLDSQGAVWVALMDKEKFIRVREGGEVTDQILLPGARTVALMLGGSERKSLYLCSTVLPPKDLSQQKAAGSIHSVQVAVAGAGWP